MKKKYIKYSSKIDQIGGYKIKCKSSDDKICESKTNYMGLCVKNDFNCNSEYDPENASVPQIIFEDNEDDKKLQQQYEIGIKKGYVETELTNSCYGHENDVLDYTNIIKENENIIPKNFSILTFNIMGIHRCNPYVDALMYQRSNMLSELLIESNSDILCFQEMSPYLFELIYLNNEKMKELYPYYHEKTFTKDKLEKRGPKNDVQPFVISKYQPNKVIMKALGGVLDYSNALLIIEFENLIVFNYYFQAGSKASPGQEPKWMHYSRCRSQHFSYIKQLLLNEKYNNKAKIVLGDFNFDLNGNDDDWPEIIKMKELELKDSWKETHDDSELGLTEDTDINTLRWNDKFEKKMFRYDAILYNDNILKPLKSKIIGNEPTELNSEFDFAYENSILPKMNIDDKRRDKIKKSRRGKYELFISDHFGVQSNFKFI